MTKDHQQYYLRAEPTAEGRAVLRTHQAHLARVFRDLAINPRLTRADDLHWTPIFLGSPERWTRVLRAVDADITLTSDDLLSLTLPKSVVTHFGSVRTHPTGIQLPQIAAANFGSSTTRPTGYDVFFNGATSAVFVLRLHEAAAAPAEAVLAHVGAELQRWEQNRRLPGGTAARLSRHPWFPLRRELNGGKPHITLARGRVSRARQRDVLRTLRATPIVSRAPIAFTHAEIRITGPAATSNHDA